MITSKFYLRAFSDNVRHGNDVLVATLSRSPFQEEWQELAELSQKIDSQGNPQTICFIVTPDTRKARNNMPTECRWYQGGGEVKLCGSGIVAAAYVLDKHLKTTLPHLLKHSDQAIEISLDNRQYGFSLPYFQLNREAIPDASARWFQYKPTECMSCGGSEGYWILEFSEPITAITPNLDAICANTRRAIIATSAHAPEGYDYSLRYFAPQYGVDEDLATGSANAVLASYWRQKQRHKTALLAATRFKALQYQGENEERGGTISLELKDSNVWVGGRVNEV